MHDLSIFDIYLVDSYQDLDLCSFPILNMYVPSHEVDCYIINDHFPLLTLKFHKSIRSFRTQHMVFI